MKTANIFTLILLTVVLFILGLVSYQITELHSTNKMLYKAVANMATEFKEITTPPPPPDVLEPGEPAPDFALVSTSLDTVSLAALSNSTDKLVVFSSVDCSYCKEYYPELHKFKEKYPAVEIVVVQLDATPEENKAFLEKNAYDFTMLTATPEVFHDYKISGTPTTVILHKDNTVKASFIVETSEELEKQFLL